ncbi:hypothetical protein R6Q57_011659 [Mikania cordata]
MSMGTPRCIDWGVLADCGEAVRARVILGEDTPWTRLFELAELPTYKLITGGAFITHIGRTKGMVDMLDDLPAIEPHKLDRRMIISMKLAADIPDLGLRFIGHDGGPFQPA